MREDPKGVEVAQENLYFDSDTVSTPTKKRLYHRSLESSIVTYGSTSWCLETIQASGSIGANSFRRPAPRNLRAGSTVLSAAFPGTVLEL